MTQEGKSKKKKKVLLLEGNKGKDEPASSRPPSPIASEIRFHKVLAIKANADETSEPRLLDQGRQGQENDISKASEETRRRMLV